MSYSINRIIKGKFFDTETATKVMHIPCYVNGQDFSWENTDLYISPNRQWFLAGEGNAASRWAARQVGGSVEGDGIQLVTEDEAKALLERHDGPFERYFEVAEG